MTPDPLQEAWQSQPRPAIATDQLVREFRRGQQQFAATIFWRDVREVGVSLLLLPVWVAMGIGIGLPWTWYPMMPALLLGRRVHDGRLGRARGGGGQGRATRLMRGVECSLAEVEHQILAATERGLVVPAAPGHPDIGVPRPDLLAHVEREHLGGGHRYVLRGRHRWGRLRLGLLAQPKGRPRCSPSRAVRNSRRCSGAYRTSRSPPPPAES